MNVEDNEAGIEAVAAAGNKAPRSKLRGINKAFQTAGYRQPSPQWTENSLEEIKAFHYVRNGETSSCRAEDVVAFDDMIQLSKLLAHFAGNAHSIVPKDATR